MPVRKIKSDNEAVLGASPAGVTAAGLSPGAEFKSSIVGGTIR